MYVVDTPEEKVIYDQESDTYLVQDYTFLTEEGEPVMTVLTPAEYAEQYGE